MKISVLEEHIVKNRINNETFIKFIETIKDDLEYDYNDERKLISEEIDYSYFDETTIEYLENLNFSEENFCADDKNGHCCCNEHHTNKRVEKNIRLVYIMGMYLLKEGIDYIDLVQEGIIGLIEADNLYSETTKFERYKSYYIAKNMIIYIMSYSLYREIAFKGYIHSEKEKEIKMKLSPRVRLKYKDKSDEIKKLELEKKLEHQKNLIKLEKMTKNMFNYFNLKYRLSIKEIEILVCYFGLDGKGKKNFSDIETMMNITLDEVDILLKEGIYKLSMFNEKVEI